MAAYGADGRCLMRALQAELDDPERGRLRALRRVHRSRGSPRRPTALVELAERHLRCAAARARGDARWRPTPAGRCARSPRTPAPSPAGRWHGSATAAGGRRSSAGWRAGPLGRRDRRRAGRRRAWLRSRRGVGRAVPSSGVGDTLDDLAPRSGRRARRAVPDLVARTEAATAAARAGQRGAAGGQRPWRVRGRRDPLPRGAGDPARRPPQLSGWTLAMVGGQLRRAGATAVTPVVLATLG